MSKKKKLAKEDWPGEVVFALAECDRIAKVVASAATGKKLKDIPKKDVLATLPHPSGRGDMLCGQAAYQRLHHLAALALKDSAYAETATLGDVFSAFRKLVSARFLSKKQEPTLKNVQSALAEAIQEAASKCRDATHFVPCRLTYAKNAAEFALGKVTFRASKSFNETMASTFTAYLDEAKDEKEKEWDEKHLKSARAYYDAFTWAAEVKVFGCAPDISKQRAFLAVQTAVGVLQLLLGTYHTRRMAVGGPMLASDRRSHFYLSDAGKLQVSTSSDSTSAVGFEDGWEKILARDDFAFLLDGAAKVIAPIIDPTLKRPLSQRFVDAVSWYGEAAREHTDASRVIKSVTAIERLVMTGKVDKTTETISHRAAMIRCSTGLDKDFARLLGDMSRYYDLRSRLAHGDLSPFDPIVSEHAPACVAFAEKTLCAGLAFLNSYKLFDEALTNKQLAHGYDVLVAEAANAWKANGKKKKTSGTDDATVSGAD